MRVTKNWLGIALTALAVCGLPGCKQGANNKARGTVSSQGADKPTTVAGGEETIIVPMQEEVELPSHSFMMKFEDTLSNSDIAKRLDGFTIYEVLPVGNSKGKTFYITFGSNLEVLTLQESLEKIDGVKYVGLNAPFSIDPLREKHKGFEKLED